ncbi:MAG: histidine triad nucleotide-binding protein [Candidatus Gastranaerophilales bacterium]|nr:histidine triad nucleotide-binding protein [Candidatus Gastranaerophilales bacterium]
MSENCIFCKIANKEIKIDLVLETEDLVAFKDINAQAPFHILVIPKKHYETLNDIKNPELLGKLFEGVQNVVKKLNIEDGYRTVINTGKKAGQEVFHLHIHILAGRPFTWPPG